VTVWTVALRGIRYRWGRSLAVLLLAVLAVTAAVLAPAYARASQQSVLFDGLANAPATSTGLLANAVTPADAAASTIPRNKIAIENAMLRHPALRAALGSPVASLEAETVLGDPADMLAARLVRRDNVCEHLAVTGICPSTQGQVLVSNRTARERKLEVGQPLLVHPGGSTGFSRTKVLTITGTYTPDDPTAAYWGRAAYFSNELGGPDSAGTRIDALFTGVEEDVRALGTDVRLRVEYPLKPVALTIDTVRIARDDLKSLGRELPAAGGLQVSSALPGVLDDIVVEQTAIARTVPMVAAPLILLSLFVLFLLVAAVTEERSPELALAKLRGYPLTRTGQFGLTEILVLIVLAAPLGLGVGMLLVYGAASLLLAPGTGVEWSAAVLTAAAASTAAAVLAALVAGWRAVGRTVLTLLRRVPNRAGWRTAAGEAAVATLAAVALWVALRDPSSSLVLVAPPLLALLASMIVTRLLAGYAWGALRRARRGGRLSALLAAGQLARRPGPCRVAAVLTVAIALLTFAATLWDVAAVARSERARAAVGADRVYTVDVPHPDALVAAVAQADPKGGSMAVVRSRAHYGNGFVELIGVDSTRLPVIANWADYPKSELNALVGKLRPTQVPAVSVRGRIEVDTTVLALRTEKPVRLVAVVSAAGEPPRTVNLGALATGTRTYTATLPGCVAGCRLVGLGLSRTPGTTDVFSADFVVTAVRGSGEQVETGFAAGGRWRPQTARAPQAEVMVRPGTALTLEVRSGDAGDVLAEYVSAPDALPVVVAGAVPADDRQASTFQFPALIDKPQQFTVVAKAEQLPRAGTWGLLFDLDYAVRSAERTTSLADVEDLRYEVWASPDAPTDLDKRLTAVGAHVVESDSIAQSARRLDRLAPALALRLYLFAGVAAMLLAVGSVLLSAYIGATARLSELTALRLVGVSVATLRRGLLREYFVLLGISLMAGIFAGVGGAGVTLPGLQLVSVKDPIGLGRIADAVGLGWLPLTLGAVAIGLVLAVAVLLRVFGQITLNNPEAAAR
jgi:hypothetical protein